MPGLVPFPHYQWVIDAHEDCYILVCSITARSTYENYSKETGKK